MDDVWAPSCLIGFSFQKVFYEGIQEVIAKMVSSCFIWLEYDLNLSHLNIAGSGSVRSGLQQVGPLHPTCVNLRSTQTTVYFAFNSLTPWAVKSQHFWPFGTINLWPFILIFARCKITKSLWIAWSTRIRKFEIDGRIMWSRSWLKLLENRLHVAWSGFSLASFRQGFVISDLSEVPGPGQHINIENIEYISTFQSQGSKFKMVSMCMDTCVIQIYVRSVEICRMPSA